ncbi:MAG TPA: hypothetical protein VFY01_04090, partial [Rheinheimera sp.]|nr:hypothetical protein [Rheinheimera sp.]
MKTLRNTVVAALLVICPLAVADTLFSEDFQSGQYSSWSLSGTGYDSANLYSGNYSLRLDGLRQASIALNTSGFTDVSLEVDLAALYLVNGDYCYADYSTNGGSSWQNLLTVANGQDDGYFRSATVANGLDNQANLMLRFRAYSLYGNYCYADNILLSGVEAEPVENCDYDCLAGNGAVTRSALTYSQLSGTTAINLQNYSHYALPANAANPLNQFSGTLTLSIVNGTLTEQGTALAGSYTNPNRLPDFSFQFIQHGTHLIPLQRQLIAT